jgi:glycerol-3-phosphate O-acyltransferase
LSLGQWALLVLAGFLIGSLTLWSIRRTRNAIRRRANRAVLRAVRRFQVHIDRYKLVRKQVIRETLLEDPTVLRAMRVHGQRHGVSELETRVRVEQYVDEIVPYFNILSYYKLGYNVARVFINLLYRVSSEYQDVDALNAIPKQDVVVYLMNHRSNADYVVVAYALARSVSISYAVGEWARIWPLEYVFKSFGAYFVRRGYREPLYHTVLERYVQLITRNGVTQGIFLEGGLSRDGSFRPAKIGLLDYVARTVGDSRFDRNIWLVPVAINYDRVLEDRSLIRELIDERDRPSRLRQLGIVMHYVSVNVLRLITGNLKRYGRVAVNFGTPLSLHHWLDSHPSILDRPREDRLPELQKLADEMMLRIADIMPVTPVPLVAASLLSFSESVIHRGDLLERVEAYRGHLRRTDAKLVRADRAAADIIDRAWRMFAMRRLVVREGDRYIVLPRQRPLLEYYANSLRHLLPAMPRDDTAMHPAFERDESLPKLRRWVPRDKRGG